MAGTDDLRYAYAELCAARPEYAKAESYFVGDVDEIFASDKVARLLAKSNLNDLDEVNFARIPVTAVTDRLHVTSITADDEDADAEIAELFRRNELDEELPGLHVRACSQGDAYLMVWPALSAPMEDGGEPPVEAVDMFVHGPATVRAIYDPEYPLRIAYVIKSWRVGSGKDQAIRADMYYPPRGEKRARVERWIWKGKHSGKQDKWQPYGDDDQPWMFEHDWGLSWFHYRTARPYGRPEHQGAYGPQAIINKVVLGHASSIDYQALKQRYGLIDPVLDQSGQQSDFDPDNPEDGAGDPESPNNGSQLSSDPGEFWQLQGYRAVGEFSAADPDVFMKPFDRYIKAMAQVTDTPMHIFDSTGDRISGESRREANAPLIAKVQARQRSFGATHAAAFNHALSLLGIDDVTVKVTWLPAEQINDADGWATVKAKIDAGVPRREALIEAGYLPEIVDSWLADLDDDAELQRRLDLLVTLGDAVQRLAQGVALGAITEQQVATILDGVLDAAQRTDRELTSSG